MIRLYFNLLGLCLCASLACAENPDIKSKGHESIYYIKKSKPPVYYIEAKKLAAHEQPEFYDDLDFEHLQTALQRQLARFQQRSMRGRIVLGDHTYPIQHIQKSLKKLQHLLQYNQNCRKTSSYTECADEFNLQMQSMFDVFVPDIKPGDKGYHTHRPGLFTAYHTPTLNASLTKTKTHPYAIYRMPRHRALRGQTFVDIALNGALENQGLELFYVSDLFDLYLLHVQGGGRVLYHDAQGRSHSVYIQYTGTNQKAFDFISNYMFKKGYIANKSIAAQKKFLNENPDKWAEIYSSCPSYVYFERTEHPPWGSDAVPLTPHRSIALDRHIYKFKGLLTFVQSVKPAKVQHRHQGLDSLGACQPRSMQKFSRFFLHQDTGGAIRGKTRGDLYFGEDHYAACVAYNQYHRGHIYLLMLKL